MEIKLPQNQAPEPAPAGVQGRGGIVEVPHGATVIAQNLRKQSVYIDRDGNQVDPGTKRVIKSRDN